MPQTTLQVDMRARNYNSKSLCSLYQRVYVDAAIVIVKYHPREQHYVHQSNQRQRLALMTKSELLFRYEPIFERLRIDVTSTTAKTPPLS